jgi:S1-C subfamily serine protease
MGGTMRKSIVVSLAVVMALLATAVGIILAQDNTGTAWLGVRLAEDSETGVTIENVTTGSPAETGGLLVGDMIVSVDGEAVETAQELTDAIQSHTPGDTVSIVILRDGSESTLEIELGSVQERGHGNFDSSDPVSMASRMLHVQLSATDEGYQVVAGRMRDESLLAVDDIITAVNGTAIADVDWQALQDELANQDSPVITLTVLHDGEETTVELEQIGGLHGSTDGRTGWRSWWSWWPEFSGRNHS